MASSVRNLAPLQGAFLLCSQFQGRRFACPWLPSLALSGLSFGLIKRTLISIHRKTDLVTTTWLLILISVCASEAISQTPTYPKEIRGYKVARAVIEIEKPKQATGETKTESRTQTDTLIQLGEPSIARVTPLGITFEVPVIVAPVKQRGKIDFLTFEDIIIHGTPVSIDEYDHPFELPRKLPVTLREPLSIYIYLPTAVLAALDEWSNSKDEWLVTGRIYVFGRFKKSFLKFKRVVPVELNLTIRNPLKTGSDFDLLAGRGRNPAMFLLRKTLLDRRLASASRREYDSAGWSDRLSAGFPVLLW